MAARKRSADTSAEQTPVPKKPKRLRGIIAAFLAAIVIVLVTAVVTTIVVDAVHGRTNLFTEAAGGSSQQENDVDAARAAGYKAGVRDTKQIANDRLSAKYDQGFAKGYAKGRADVKNNEGSQGGYPEGYNAGVTAAVDAYKKIIAQAQQIIADAGQVPVTTAPTPTTTTG